MTNKITLKWKKRGRPKKKEVYAKKLAEKILNSDETMALVNKMLLDKVLFGAIGQVYWDGSLRYRSVGEEK